MKCVTVLPLSKNTTELQPTAFLTEIHRLLATKKKYTFSVCPTANHCQGQLPTPQSVTVLAKQFAEVTEEEMQKHGRNQV